MTRSSALQAVAFVLSALVTFGAVAGVNGLATQQYATARAVVMARASIQDVALAAPAAARALKG